MEILKMLRKQNGLKQDEVAKMLEIKQRTYSSYENSENEPNIKILKKLSNIFNVSIDYIVGNDIKGKTVYTEEQRQIFNMIANLNEINTLKAYSYIAGLLAGQE